jgi:asparagine synthase (glutamine-hydrolysing)
MCGIAGTYLSKSSKSNQAYLTVDKMLDSLSHRGPDSKGIKLIQENICIGNTRLSIVDVENGDQPQSDGKNLHIVFNGEIYNFQELKKQYLLDYKFSTDTDTEVILQGYKKFGLNIFSQLNGMLAVCIIDSDKLILARDRLGVKPLYYRIDRQGLSFASEMKVLSNKNDKYKIPDYYTFFETTINNDTLNENIVELPPGSILTFDGTSIQIQKYWNLTKKIDFMTNKNEKEYIEELRYLILDSIKIRKPEMSFGVSISGGLDSAIVAVISKPDYLFTSVTKGQQNNEEEFADILSEYLNTPLIKTYPDKDDFIKTLPNLINSLDYPTTTLAAYPMYQLFREMKKHVKVVLTGQGADELFGGYMRYVLFYIDYLKKFTPELHNYAPLELHYWGDQFKTSLDSRYLKLLSRSNETIKTDGDIKTILDKAGRRPITAACIADIIISFPPLLRTDDRMSMAWSIESRSPFLDYRLVEFALSLPDKYKIRISNTDEKQGTFITKYLLKKAIGDLLPSSILNRLDKVGYQSPVSTWLKDDFKNLTNNLKQSNDTIPSGLFLHNEESRGNYSRSDWQLLQLYIWKWIFIERSSLENIATRIQKLI